MMDGVEVLEVYLDRFTSTIYLESFEEILVNGKSLMNVCISQSV